MHYQKIGACHKNCVNDHKMVENQRRQYGHGTKKERERKRYYRPNA